MSHRTSPRIAIIGAGPGGLTLARLLQMHGHSTTIFERETSSTDRPQGGTLDLHPGSGLHAVHLAGLDTQFQAIDAVTTQEYFTPDRPGGPMDADGPGAIASTRKLIDLAERKHASLIIFGHDGPQWSTLKQLPDFFD